MSETGRAAAWKRLAAALVCAAWCLLPFLLPPDPSIAQGIDSSWRIGLTQAWWQGEISGRDLYATYGPLYQLLGRAAQKMHATGNPYDSLFLLLLLENALAVLALGVALAAIDRIGWPSVAFVLLTLFFFGFLQGAVHRPAVALLAVIALWRAARSTDRKLRLLGAAGAGLLAFAAQLLSFEAGIYAVAAGVASLLLLALFSRFGFTAGRSGLPSVGESLSAAASFAGTFAAANLALAAFFAATGAGGFLTYPRAMLEMVRGYGYTLAFPWVLPPLPTVALLVLALYVALAIVLDARRLAGEDLSLLVFLGVFSAILWKSAVVRADADHIWLGALGTLMLFLLLGRGFLPGRRLAARALWGAALLLFLAVWPGIALERLILPFRMAQQGISPFEGVPVLRQFNGSRAVPLPPALAARRRIPEGLLIFPYQTHLAAVAARPLVAPVIQAYQADTVWLQRLYVEQLERRREPYEVLYLPDGAGSDKLERVQSLTRSPAIFEYLFENFAPLPGGTPGALLLTKRLTPRPLRSRELRFVETTGAGPYREVALAAPATCALVRLHLKVGYPLLAAIGRPSHVEARVTAAGREVIRTALVSLNGQDEFATDLFLLPDEALAPLWNGEPVSAPAWDRIAFTAMDDSFLAWAPKAVEVSRLECLEE